MSLAIMDWEDYPVVSVFGRSTTGGIPDRSANKVLTKLGFVCREGVSEDMLFSEAVPAPGISYALRVKKDGERGLRWELYLKDGVKEFRFEEGRVLNRTKDAPKAKHVTFCVEGGRLLEWKFKCQDKNGDKGDSVWKPSSGSTPLLFEPNELLTHPSSEAVKIQKATVSRKKLQQGLAKAPQKVSCSNSHSSPRLPESSGGIIHINAGEVPKLPVVPEEPVPEVRCIRVDRIRAFKGQPRTEFSKGNLLRLGKSLLSRGQRMLIEVFPIEGDPHADYELITGERRWRASKLVGKPTLNAVVRKPEEVGDKRKRHQMCMAADFLHETYSKRDTAVALLEERQAGTSVEDLAVICGKNIEWVYHHLALNDLVPELQALLSNDLPRGDRLSFPLAWRLARFPKEMQLEIHKKVSTIKGAALQLIEIKKLLSERVPEQSRGRPRKPADYCVKLRRLTPRILADVLTADAYPNKAFMGLVATDSTAEIVLMRSNIKKSIAALRSLDAKLGEAQKKSRR